MTLRLGRERLTLATLRSIAREGVPIALDPACLPAIEAAAKRIERVLWNDPASGVMRHADAGYEAAIACAREKGLRFPMLK